MAPHIAEELWHLLGNTKTLAYEPWPEFDPALLVEDQVEIPVQVNGKLRGRVVVAADSDAAASRASRPRRLADRRPPGRQDRSQGRGGAGQAGQFRRGLKDGTRGPCRFRSERGLEASMTRSHYLVGIDLGTTNCAVAYVDTHGRERPAADIRNFPVPQLVAPGETAPRAMLPSFLYLPGSTSCPRARRDCPGTTRPKPSSANSRGFKARRCPLAASRAPRAGSAIPGIDREADILPWGSPPEVKKVSPVEASADYLRHIRDAWNDTFASDNDSMRLEQQEVVLTVPASFDEAARADARGRQAR